MTKVEAIQPTNNHYGALRTLGTGAALGAAVGMAGKYLLPVQQDEKTSDEYIKVMNKIREQKTEYSFRTEKYLNTLREKPNRTMAEDEFIGLFRGMKEGEHVKRSSIRGAITRLEAKDSLQAAEFRNICKETSKIAEITAKQCMNAYNLITKHIRPTGFFLATGAVVGAFIALINDVLKTEVKH